jgi:hypothetical protein
MNDQFVAVRGLSTFQESSQFNVSPQTVEGDKVYRTIKDNPPSLKCIPRGLPDFIEAFNLIRTDTDGESFIFSTGSHQ